VTAPTGSNKVITVEGLREFRKALKEAGDQFPAELKAAHLSVADIAARVSQAEARRMGGVQAKAAGSLRGSATATQARLQVKPSKSKRNATAMANVAFWGAKKRTGWYAQKRYADSPRVQHPEWIGNTWDVMDPSAGPYAINKALSAHQGDIYDAFDAALDRLISRAFGS
jgi:hypothetical protein